MNENDAEKSTDEAISEVQLATLQKSISSLQEELNSKNEIIGNMNKNKDRLAIDLKKYKRANSNLKQQLEDERAFYLKEKEYYCKEMNVSKQMRKKQNEEQKNVEDVTGQLREVDNLKKDVSKLRSVLNETLEANYNLSVKFLRMKNTKYTLKARYKREQTENAKIISDLTAKLGHTREEILHIISDKFRQSIPPSNKKYLQVSFIFI